MNKKHSDRLHALLSVSDTWYTFSLPLFGCPCLCVFALFGCDLGSARWPLQDLRGRPPSRGQAHQSLLQRTKEEQKHVWGKLFGRILLSFPPHFQRICLGDYAKHSPNYFVSIRRVGAGQMGSYANEVGRT